MGMDVSGFFRTPSRNLAVHAEDLNLIPMRKRGKAQDPEERSQVRF